ncbi:MAG: hypothetical protein IPP34_18815 [Bacteroidetes bacterium]|nr:hypothetical protein [Bacteroidota bacterium]
MDVQKTIQAVVWINCCFHCKYGCYRTNCNTSNVGSFHLPGIGPNTLITPILVALAVSGTLGSYIYIHWTSGIHEIIFNVMKVSTSVRLSIRVVASITVTFVIVPSIGDHHFSSPIKWFLPADGYQTTLQVLGNTSIELCINVDHTSHQAYSPTLVPEFMSLM